MPTSKIKRVHVGNASLESYMLSLGPVGYWRLGETNGVVAADISSNGNNGTYTGGVTIGQKRNYFSRDSARAAAFDGTDDYVTLGQPAVLDFIPRTDPYSWVFWAESDPTLGTGYMLAKRLSGGADAQNSFLMLSSGYIRIAPGGIVSDVNIDYRGALHCFAMTVPAASTGAKVYVDGVLKSFDVGTGGIGLSGSKPYDTLIAARRGVDNTDHSTEFEGWIQEVAAFDKVLTADEILAMCLIGTRGP